VPAFIIVLYGLFFVSFLYFSHFSSLAAYFFRNEVEQICMFQVDIHIMTNPSVGQWTFFDTEITDTAGRVSYHIPDSKRLPEGMYPVKMVVR